jgi:hypothetical protein
MPKLFRFGDLNLGLNLIFELCNLTLFRIYPMRLPRPDKSGLAMTRKEGLAMTNKSGRFPPAPAGG